MSITILVYSSTDHGIFQGIMTRKEHRLIESVFTLWDSMYSIKGIKNPLHLTSTNKIQNGDCSLGVVPIFVYSFERNSSKYN